MDIIIFLEKKMSLEYVHFASGWTNPMFYNFKVLCGYSLAYQKFLTCSSVYAAVSWFWYVKHVKERQSWNSIE